MKTKRWQDWANLILGLWLAFSPWVLSFTDNLVAARTAWVLGAVIAVFAGIAVYIPKLWEEVVNVIVGACLLGSPWIFGYAAHENASNNAAIVGTLVIALGISAMLRDTHFQRPAALP